jgi:probable O-glycosylation ligase (exosortase A-associated)
LRGDQEKIVSKFLVIIICAIVVISTLARPWIGVVTYYFYAILGPQYILFWTFDGLSPSRWVALATIAGIAIKIFSNDCPLSFLKKRLNFWVFLLWIFVDLSFFTGPYVSQVGASDLSPAQLFSMANTMYFFYLISALILDKQKHLKYLGWAIIVSTIYLTYWANMQYLTQNWRQFDFGRLMGPVSPSGGTMYVDQNGFAMVFATGIPFVVYFATEIRRRWLRYVLWATVPLSVHAIFLTGSRGGLVGISVVILTMIFLSRKKFLALPIILLFLVFYQWQAGSIMKSRETTITNYEGESSAEGRVIAWKAGYKMILAHPLTGVGLGAFQTAMPDFSTGPARVAHNTFIQIAGESGVAAGICYLMIIITFFRNWKRVSSWSGDHGDSPEFLAIRRYNKASAASFTGLITCSLFLSLNFYEIFLFLLLFNNSLEGITALEQNNQGVITYAKAC